MTKKELIKRIVKRGCTPEAAAEIAETVYPIFSHPRAPEQEWFKKRWSMLNEWCRERLRRELNDSYDFVSDKWKRSPTRVMAVIGKDQHLRLKRREDGAKGAEHGRRGGPKSKRKNDDLAEALTRLPRSAVRNKLEKTYSPRHASRLIQAALLKNKKGHNPS